jgi:8-oxo-dGTP diphosphatase
MLLANTLLVPAALAKCDQNTQNSLLGGHWRLRPVDNIANIAGFVADRSGARCSRNAHVVLQQRIQGAHFALRGATASEPQHSEPQRFHVLIAGGVRRQGMVSPQLAVDCVITDEAGNIVLIKRKHEPFKDAYALPGGFVEVGETVEDACRREMKEETNLELKDLQLVGVYSAPNRDPRGHVIAVAYMARSDLSQLSAGDDATQAEVVGNWRDRPLAFDHRQIIEDAYGLLRTRALA